MLFIIEHFIVFQIYELQILITYKKLILQIQIEYFFNFS